MRRDVLWIVLVSDGDRIEYPPEVFASESVARREAYRWAWSMSSSGSSVRVKHAAGWSAGIRDILVIPGWAGSIAVGKCWVVAAGRGPIAGGVGVQVVPDRPAALELVKAWADRRGSEVIVSPLGLWSGANDMWIDAQRAKCCC
jgi:hypothetical protein